MQQTTSRQASGLLLIAAWFLATISAFFSVIWLIPQLVLLETFLWILLAILCLWSLKKRNQLPKFFESLRRNWFILPFVIFSGLSIFWSVYWEISLFRWLILLCTIIAAGFIGFEYEIKLLTEKLAIFGICIFLLSALFIYFIPQIGVMNYYTIQGAWRGVFWHKNHLGLMTSFLISYSSSM